MSDVITLAPKSLGAMALEDFCPRCWWLQQKCKAPWQIFPGIFSSLDAYQKHIVNVHLSMFNKLPKWMGDLGPGPHKSLKPLHWSKFKWTDPATGITLRGQTDLMIQDATGVIHIPDLKTAKFTENQDKLLPMYRVQNNSYAMINESLGGKSGMTPLIYCEPVTGPEACSENVYHDTFFDLHFRPQRVEVERDFNMVLKLLDKARTLLDGPLPGGRENCPDCKKLSDLILTIGLEEAARD